MANENNESKLPADGDNNPPISQQPVGSNSQVQYPMNPQGINAVPPASLNQVTMQQPLAGSTIPGLGPMHQGKGGIPGLGAAFGAQQPPVQWMMPPPPSPDCHPGLECLQQLDELTVVQQLNVVELVRHVNLPNRYDVKNKFGQQVFMIAEERLPFRCCDCFSRVYHMRGFDGNQKEVLHFSKQLKCCCCCCIPCISNCLENMNVEAPTGTPIGSALQISRFGPKLEILDTSSNKLLNVRGPFTCSCCFARTADYTFQVTDAQDQNIATIIKHWGGLRAVVSQDPFKVNFPMDLDVKQKALIVAVTILMDYMMFQRNQQR